MWILYTVLGVLAFRGIVRAIGQLVPDPPEEAALEIKTSPVTYIAFQAPVQVNVDQGQELHQHIHGQLPLMVPRRR